VTFSVIRECEFQLSTSLILPVRFNAAASVKLHPGAAVSAEDIRDYCKDEIATFKIPCHIKIMTNFR
jgi:hypothetical protein